MTDQIPADKVRKIASEMRAAMRRVEDAYPDGEFLMDMSDYIRDLDKLCALLPAPPRPTLADMTDEERQACRWMQCDVRNFDRRMVVTEVRTSSADLIERDGERWNASHDYVTPRPDLPRMEWPGDKKPDPAPALPDGWRLADHQTRGRVIVTTPTPDCHGNVYFVLPGDDDTMGYDWYFCHHDSLTFLDSPTTGEADTADTVPDHLAVGTVIESADDPRIDALPVGSVLIDSDEEATIKGRGDWTGAGYIPIPSEGTELGPWTVLHIPKETDQ